MQVHVSPNNNQIRYQQAYQRNKTAAWRSYFFLFMADSPTTRRVTADGRYLVRSRALPVAEAATRSTGKTRRKPPSERFSTMFCPRQGCRFEPYLGSQRNKTAAWRSYFFLFMAASPTTRRVTADGCYLVRSRALPVAEAARRSTGKTRRKAHSARFSTMFCPRLGL